MAPVVLVVLCAWQAVALGPQAGLDQSWGAALHMAVHDHIAFGRDFVFTFGPLGFLSVPTLWYASTGTIAFAYLLLVRAAVAVALFAGARRNYGAVLATLLALAAASLVAIANEAIPFLLLALLVVDGARRPRLVLSLLGVAGAVAGIELLGRQSNGIALVALVAVAALAAPGSRRANVAVAAVSATASFLLSWLLLGQPLAALPDYVRNSGRIVAGYAGAMQLEEASLGWQSLLAWLPFACGLAVAVIATTGAPLRRRSGIVALWTAYCFFQYKEGFVRHDPPHGAVYFVALLGGFMVLPWRRDSRLQGLALTAVVFGLALAAVRVEGAPSLDPVANARSALAQIGEVASSSSRAEVVAEGRAAVRSELPLDARTLALVRGHSVHIVPYQAALAWAYQLDWDPLPVPQSYSAYTVGLDQLDANRLASAKAPQRILRSLEPGIDGRLQSFDEPAATRAILCRYRQLYETSAWQVLARARDRCGAPAPVEVVHAGWDQPVAVPPPPNRDSLVYVRIDGAGPQGLERLGALAYKPYERTIALDGGPPRRLVAGTASDGLPLRASPGVDYPAPFNYVPQASTVAVGNAGKAPGSGGPLTFSFYAVSVFARG